MGIKPPNLEGLVVEILGKQEKEGFKSIKVIFTNCLLLVHDAMRKKNF
ncbi:hypothetical protein [Priestia megaterium]